MPKHWSKLQREIYKLIDSGIGFQIHCSVYRMDSRWGGTDLPRYWITLGKEIIFDYPKDFLDKKLLERGLITSCTHNETVVELYPYVTEISLISDIIRAYIDTPLEGLLSHDFEADDFGITDILKASDRRIGKRRLAEHFKDTDNEAVKKILSARGEMTMDKRKTSVFISLILRHKPQVIGISLDENGWVDVLELINGINGTGRYHIDMDMLKEIVQTDEKQRYSFNEDKTKIRANQGHSIAVDVELKRAVPPEILYHGTGEKYTEAIEAEGLKRQTRLYVHLSKDFDTSKKVGSRHGRPVVYKVKTGEMSRAGYVFYLSENGVWLTERVPVGYLERVRNVAPAPW